MNLKSILDNQTLENIQIMRSPTIQESISSIKSKFKLTEAELSLLLNVSEEELEKVCKESYIEESYRQCRLDNETYAISSLDFMEDDARLTAYIEALCFRYHLNNTIISKLTGIDEYTIEKLFSDPKSVSVEQKYTLCVKVAYLTFLFLGRK